MFNLVAAFLALFKARLFFYNFNIFLELGVNLYSEDLLVALTVEKSKPSNNLKIHKQ